MKTNEIVYEADGKKYRLREKLLAKDFEIYNEGRRIMDAVRQRKIEMIGSETELTIDMGDFSKEEFEGMVSLGLIDEEENPINKKLCPALPMDVSLKGFSAFFFIWLDLELLPTKSVISTKRFLNYLMKLQNTRVN